MGNLWNGSLKDTFSLQLFLFSLFIFLLWQMYCTVSISSRSRKSSNKCYLPNTRWQLDSTNPVNEFKHLTARELNILLRSWWTLDQKQKESEYNTYIHQVVRNVTQCDCWCSPQLCKNNYLLTHWQNTTLLRDNTCMSEEGGRWNKASMT